MRLLRDIRAFCSKRVMFASATPDFFAMSARVNPFSTRRCRKSSAILRATTSACSGIMLSNQKNYSANPEILGYPANNRGELYMNFPFSVWGFGCRYLPVALPQEDIQLPYR